MRKLEEIKSEWDSILFSMVSEPEYRRWLRTYAYTPELSLLTVRNAVEVYRLMCSGWSWSRASRALRVSPRIGYLLAVVGWIEPIEEMRRWMPRFDLWIVRLYGRTYHVGDPTKIRYMEVEMPIIVPKYFESEQIERKLGDEIIECLRRALSESEMIYGTVGAIGAYAVPRYSKLTREMLEVGALYVEEVEVEGRRVEVLVPSGGFISWGGGYESALEAWDWGSFEYRGVEYIDNVSLFSKDSIFRRWVSYDPTIGRYMVVLQCLIHIWSGHGLHWGYRGIYEWYIPIDP